MIDSYTFDLAGYKISSLYDYNAHNKVCRIKIPNSSENELDEYMWDEFTTQLEESRVVVYDTYRENGVNECESYYLSLKFLWSTLRKFRGKFFNGVNSRDEYDKMPLKMALNHLMHIRLERIMANDAYKFSAAASTDRLGLFKKESAWATAEYLAEETGAIFHAKVTL